jgi:hypothetical protein
MSKAPHFERNLMMAKQAKLWQAFTKRQKPCEVTFFYLRTTLDQGVVIFLCG